jgi:hypothetical protein
MIKKLFSLFAAVLFAGSMWAVDYDLVYTLDGSVTTGGNSNYAQDGGGLTQDGISWSVTGNTTINPWRIGGKNLNGVDRLAYSKNAIEYNIAKIEIEHGGATLTVNSITVEVASNSDFSTIVSSFTPTFTKNTTIKLDRPNDKDWSNCYYRITYNVTAGSSNSYVQLKSVKFYTVATSDPRIVADPAELAFGKKNIYFDENKTGSLDISLTGANLTGNISAALTGTNAANFSLSSASFVPTEKSVEATLTVSYEIAEVGDYSATLTLSSEGATSVVIPITLTAINKAATVYTKVMDDAELTAGDKIVIVNEEYKKAAGAVNSSSLLSVIDVADILDEENGKLSIIEEAVEVFTLGGSEGAWTLTSEAGQLSSTAAKSMSADGSTTWTITITNGDAAPYVSSTVGTLQYNHNSGNPRFTTYTSVQKAVQFYSIPVPKYAVTFNAPEHGTLVVKKGDDAITSGEKFVSGTEFTVVATPASGYKLTTLTANGTDISTTKAFSIVSETVVVVAVFDVASALDNTSVEGKAVKVLRDGQLVIEKNGVRYNAMGQVIR